MSANPARQVLTGARPQLHAVVLLLGDRADAVVLLLEDPARPEHRFLRERGEHRSKWH